MSRQAGGKRVPIVPELVGLQMRLEAAGESSLGFGQLRIQLRSMAQPVDVVSNPFVFGRPLEVGEPFEGRAYIFDWFDEFMGKGPSARWSLLHGERGSGKSSILTRLEQRQVQSHAIVLRVGAGEMSMDGDHALVWDLAKAFSASLLRSGISPPPVEKTMLLLNPWRNFAIKYWRPLLVGTGTRPLLIAVDDAESAMRVARQSEQSTSLLAFLASLEGVNQRVDFLVTTRARPIAFDEQIFASLTPNVVRRLRPLIVRETKQLLQQTPAAFVPDAVAAYVHALTKGHPGDVQRLAHALHERCVARNLNTMTTADVLAVLAYDTDALDYDGPVYRRRRQLSATVEALEPPDTAS